MWCTRLKHYLIRNCFHFHCSQSKTIQAWGGWGMSLYVMQHGYAARKAPFLTSEEYALSYVFRVLYMNCTFFFSRFG